MNILVTAGNTQTMIDQVRCITNIFSGRTGARIAIGAHDRGHQVTFLTSHPEVVTEISPHLSSSPTWRVDTYRTFEQLDESMNKLITSHHYDAIIHAAAVSDYHVAGIFGLPEEVTFHDQTNQWQAKETSIELIPASSGKVKSSHRELWMRLLPTPKLVDKIRRNWNFRGILVKFKLEVGVTEEELQTIAEKSRIQSDADFISANTLEGRNDWALIGGKNLPYRKVNRHELSEILIREVECRQRQ